MHEYDDVLDLPELLDGFIINGLLIPPLRSCACFYTLNTFVCIP